MEKFIYTNTQAIRRRTMRCKRKHSFHGRKGSFQKQLRGTCGVNVVSPFKLRQKRKKPKPGSPADRSSPMTVKKGRTEQLEELWEVRRTLRVQRTTCRNDSKEKWSYKNWPWQSSGVVSGPQLSRCPEPPRSPEPPFHSETWSQHSNRTSSTSSTRLSPFMLPLLSLSHWLLCFCSVLLCGFKQLSPL